MSSSLTRNCSRSWTSATAGALLGFFLQEIAPSIYNQAVAEVQERLQLRVSELDIEVHEDEFGYWPAQGKASRR